MAKYLNTEKIKIVTFTRTGVVSILPGQELVSKDVIPGLDKYLIDETPKKPVVDISDILEDQKSDLPDDLIVVVEDSVIEELKKEQQPKRKPRRRTK